MPSGSIFNIGVSGLIAFQRNLSTTGHNISNVNTEGYSRQRVELTAQRPIPSGMGFIGNGVDVQTTRRMFDEHATNQVRSRSSSTEFFSELRHLSEQVDNLLADPDAGIASALNAFFDSVQGLSDDPSSIPAREVMLTNAQGLVDRFDTMDEWLDDLTVTANDRIVNVVGEINALAKNIADLNNDIIVASGISGGQPPNDLLDRRDHLIDELSKRINVNIVTENNGMQNVYVGMGQSLVLGTQTMDLVGRANPDDPENFEVAYTMPNGTLVPITRMINGGQLGGVLKFRDEVLNPAKNHLGRLSMAIAETFNDQHKLGVDLDGLLGTDFFVEPQPLSTSSVFNVGAETVTTRVVDITALTTDEYRMNYDGANYTLTNLSNNAKTTLTVAAGGPPIVFNPVDGLEIEITNTPVAGDTFYIRPTRNSARIFEKLIEDPNRIAAAGPLTTGIATKNLGNAKINEATVVDFTNPAFTTVPGSLSPPIVIRFDDPPLAVPMSYSIIDANTLVPIETGIAYDPTSNVGHDVFPTPGAVDYGYRIRLDGVPQPGDEFMVNFNTNGVSDNRNALELAALQIKGTMIGGNASYHDAYSELVVSVGNQTRQSQINEQAQSALLHEAQAVRESVSGVNLDEEAANLLKYQQAYAAAAQVIAAADEVFQTLMAAVRR
ncbi:MAG: flagellar hook-associated protein FlgK [Gammaproteobacteria bacterium]|nr:flagellar hook-associated protein FlgK [Gammaproteobacteria bacterium]